MPKAHFVGDFNGPNVLPETNEIGFYQNIAPYKW